MISGYMSGIRKKRKDYSTVGFKNPEVQKKALENRIKSNAAKKALETRMKDKKNVLPKEQLLQDNQTREKWF